MEAHYNFQWGEEQPPPLPTPISNKQRLQLMCSQWAIVTRTRKEKKLA